jgi:acylphosphatase/soluble cytochrome b562
MRAFVARVFGRVQRVGYRRFVLDSAQELGVAGYVRNERDGSVTVFAQGDEAVLERFVERLKSPPPPAQVRSVDVRDVAPKPRLKYFVIKPSPLHEELQEGFGAMQSIFMDYWGEFRDYRSEFRDYRSEFRDFRNEFRSFVGEFRDYREEFRGFVGEFRDYRNEFRSFVDEFRDYRNEFREFAKRTDENFRLVLAKYGEISDKLTTILEALVRESRETREMLIESLRLLREVLERVSR